MEKAIDIKQFEISKCHYPRARHTEGHLRTVAHENSPHISWQNYPNNQSTVASESVHVPRRL